MGDELVIRNAVQHVLHPDHRKLTLIAFTGRIRSAERVEAHLLAVQSLRTFFQPDVRTTGASMKGGRHVDQSQAGLRPLPEHPDLRHLKDQAKDLLKAGAGRVACRCAVQDRPAIWLCELAEAQSPCRIVARRSGSSSRPSTPTISTRVKTLMTRNPELHRAPLGYGKNGPLTWVAECRVPREPPSAARLAMARVDDRERLGCASGRRRPAHAGRADGYRIPMMELLVAHGADVNARWNASIRRSLFRRAIRLRRPL